MSDHLISGPSKEWLNASEAAAWLGIGRKLFLITVKELKAPSVQPGKKTMLWHWRDLVAISIMMGWTRHQEEVIEPRQRS